MNDLELANYRVTELVSHGRDLDVYEVWSLERSCACMAKVIRPDRWSERQEERLRLEAKLLLTLTHPHLVCAYELIERPTIALIEEMHGGQTLGALLVERPRLPVVHLANMIEQLCSVVGYLHGNGFLHLDIKPSNIIADHGRLVLIDLSLAHAPGVGPRGWGTRSYLSPEQATGGAYTSATDVWAVRAHGVHCGNRYQSV